MPIIPTKTRKSRVTRSPPAQAAPICPRMPEASDRPIPARQAIIASFEANNSLLAAVTALASRGARIADMCLIANEKRFATLSAGQVKTSPLARLARRGTPIEHAESLRDILATAGRLAGSRGGFRYSARLLAGLHDTLRDGVALLVVASTDPSAAVETTRLLLRFSSDHVRTREMSCGRADCRCGAQAAGAKAGAAEPGAH